MGITPTKRSPAKNGRSPVKERRSRSKALKVTASPAKEVIHSHVLPDPEQRKANGRVSGRDLIAWTRPRMMEKLMLHMQYECVRYKINMPWDAIAHRLHPGSSGAAVLQHLNRVRRDLITEGHLVPPLAQKPGLAAQSREPNLRGYIRKFPHGNDAETTRPVYFNEKIEDLKQSLPGGEDDIDEEAENDWEMGDDNTAKANSPLTPSPSQPVPVTTPTRTGRSGSLATSHSDGALHGGREYHVPAHQTASSFDGALSLGRPCFQSPENGQSLGYTNGPHHMSRSFDGRYFSQQEGSVRPEMRPQQNWPGWADNHGCYVMMPHAMPPGQDIQQMYSQTNGFLMGPWSHPMNHPHGYHAPVANMPGPYANAHEQQATQSPLSSPQKTPKAESPDRALFNHIHDDEIDETVFPGSIEESGGRSVC